MTTENGKMEFGCGKPVLDASGKQMIIKFHSGEEMLVKCGWRCYCCDACDVVRSAYFNKIEAERRVKLEHDLKTKLVLTSEKFFRVEDYTEICRQCDEELSFEGKIQYCKCCFKGRKIE